MRYGPRSLGLVMIALAAGLIFAMMFPMWCLVVVQSLIILMIGIILLG